MWSFRVGHVADFKMKSVILEKSQKLFEFFSRRGWDIVKRIAAFTWFRREWSQAPAAAQPSQNRNHAEDMSDHHHQSLIICSGILTGMLPLSKFTRFYPGDKGGLSRSSNSKNLSILGWVNIDVEIENAKTPTHVPNKRAALHNSPIYDECQTQP